MINEQGKKDPRPRDAHLSGRFRPPGDKSISHRAIILAGLARGSSWIQGLNPGEDCAATLRAMGLLGAGSAPEDAGVRIQGTGGRLATPAGVLDCGNSGTTMRLLMGLAAAGPGLALFTGDRSLCGRPMDRVARPLREMGASLWLREERFAPLAIRGGPLRPIRYPMPVASAQVKSGVLLAGLFTAGLTGVVEALPTRDHTERLLEHLGGRVVRADGLVGVDGPMPLTGRRIAVPGDISAAAFPLTAGLIVEGSRVTALGVGVNPTRTAVLAIFERMGARLAVTPCGGDEALPEETADLTVEAGRLSGVEIGAAEAALAMDELPVLAVAACCASGVTTIRGAQELRIKESDRIGAMAAGLSRLGARVEELEDGLAIRGGGPGFRFSGGTVDARGDHRVAMALTVAGLRATGEVRVEGVESVALSDPGFFRTLDELRRG